MLRNRDGLDDALVVKREVAGHGGLPKSLARTCTDHSSGIEARCAPQSGWNLGSGGMMLALRTNLLDGGDSPKACET
jgi:hypothetical protein